MHFISVVTARFDVLFKLLNVKNKLQGTIYMLQGMVDKYFSCKFLLFNNATNLEHHARSPTPSQISIDILLQ